MGLKPVHPALLPLSHQRGQTGLSLCVCGQAPSCEVFLHSFVKTRIVTRAKGVLRHLAAGKALTAR